MKELLKIEFLKVKHYTVFKTFILLFIAFVPLIFFGLGTLNIPFFPSNHQLFGFPTVWKYITYIASLCIFLLALLVIVLVSNEIAYKTQKQNVIDGLSRKQVILSKFYVVTVLSLMSTIYIFIVGFIFGAIYSSISHVFDGIEYLLYYFIETFGFLTMALLVTVLLKKTSLSVLAYLIIFFIAGLILVGVLGDEMAQWTPINMLSDLTPFPFFRQLLAMDNSDFAEPVVLAQWLRLIISLIYVVGFVFLSYFVMKKRDL